MPAPGESTLLDCPSCDGAGCDACEDRGEFDVTGCPCAFVTDDVWHALTLVEWAHGESKILPVAGGVLDQSIGFMDSLRFVKADEARIKAARASRR